MQLIHALLQPILFKANVSVRELLFQHYVIQFIDEQIRLQASFQSLFPIFILFVEVPIFPIQLMLIWVNFID